MYGFNIKNYFSFLITEDAKALGSSMDLVVITAGLGTSIINALFAVSYLEWIQFVYDLADFRIYGEPKYSRHLAKSRNQFSLGAIIYNIIVCTGYGVINYKDIFKCLRIKETRQLKGVICRTFIPTWLPFDISQLFEIVLYLVQYTFILLHILDGVMICMLSWHSAEVVHLHFEHLNEMFKNIIDNKKKCCRKKYVSAWVQYHNHII